MDKSTLIKTQGLVKRYPVGGGHFTALKGLDLNVNSGEFVGLVGPSGSGKTTLLNIIGALDAPSEGTVEVLGKDLATLSGAQAAKHRSAFMGFIFQTYNLLPVYTAFENVEFPLLLLGKSTEERKQLVMQALDWVGIADKADSRPKMLSGGESQRVAIARAMVKQPKLVLADEPTANLDAKNSHHILETMVKLNKELGTTFVFATHDEKVISYLHRKVTLVDGSIQSDETS
ncbi:MAG: ABC transporter ATP-binding protein [Candidatus Marinimicrobia bacterium]|jgi:putative ABC transport system ATP-binding protein|nr:ABC transporter ATP-binding protein [Candidatus Neomarinimicrobiota bacterium]MBT3254641.1 ABC transporter ATP-binding protein [Candidatus Neomarinimicrobiota bacterium]MBT3576380.1 ABC transporter ATP-binding protein [Candidatus Neomarinimicrobiota bacterium]MBT3680078.1 ABC transporter ATP-binding protein [Candidatus Neomarinimicrobiota bacterium]MBT3950063.1 ABC transporter ATP-binding protein [Candidatus Neomarinimicrobiota bacterium]